MKVIALDFETANEQRSSPCSIGLAWIEDGQVALYSEGKKVVEGIVTGK